MRYTAVILTHNEVTNIRGCLDSLRDASRIIVVDSGSTDGTVEYLKAVGERVELHQRPFKSFSDQRNFATDTLCSKGEWVLHLDADERLTAKLAEELAALSEEPEAKAYNIASMTYFRGRPIPHASGFPVYQTRLTRAHDFRFVEVGHGQKAPTELGKLPRLKNYYEHHPFEKGLSEWIQRHDRYSTLEAREVIERADKYTFGAALNDSIARRQWLKQFSRRLPFRPMWIYFYLLILRGGFLDGPEGRDYCRMRAMYEQMIDLKVREFATRVAVDAETIAAKEHRNV